MKNFIEEFKKFAIKGNAIDMAVGVVIGGAFGKIVTSLVNDVIMPPLGLLLGRVDFKQLAITLNSPIGDIAPVTIRYGMFINTLLDFFLVALSIFMVIKGLNSLKKPEPAPAPAMPTTKDCPHCLSKIPIKAVKCAFCTSPQQ